MLHYFNPMARSVLVPVTIVGPRQPFDFLFAVDTGANQTCIRPLLLQRLGYNLSQTVGRTRLRSATGAAGANLFHVSAISSLDRVRTEFLVAAHDLPLSVEADGLLGLDFFRGLVLTLDFARGRVALTGFKWWWQFWR